MKNNVNKIKLIIIIALFIVCATLLLLFLNKKDGVMKVTPKNKNVKSNFTKNSNDKKSTHVNAEDNKSNNDNINKTYQHTHEWEEYGYYREQFEPDVVFSKISDYKKGDIVECCMCGKTIESNNITIDILKKHLLHCSDYINSFDEVGYTEEGEPYLKISDDDVCRLFMLNPDESIKKEFVVEGYKCKICGMNKEYK